jgi:hypothetical protein
MLYASWRCRRVEFDEIGLYPPILAANSGVADLVPGITLTRRRGRLARLRNSFATLRRFLSRPVPARFGSNHEPLAVCLQLGWVAAKNLWYVHGLALQVNRFVNVFIQKSQLDIDFFG